MASGPITSQQIDGETMETVRYLFSWAPKSLQMVTAAMTKRCLFLGRKAMTNLDSILKSRAIILPAKVLALVAQRLKCLPSMQETQVRSLGREDPLEKEMVIHSSILAWRIPGTGVWRT